MQHKANTQVVWLRLAEQLQEVSKRSYNENIRELGIIIAVILQAAKDNDIEYFETGAYKYYCHLLRLNSDSLKTVLLRAIKYLN